MNNIEQLANQLLKESGFSSSDNTRVRLTAEAREWDARFHHNNPWPSLAVQKKNKKGELIREMRDKYPSEAPVLTEKAKQTSIGTPGQCLFTVRTFVGGETQYWRTYPATAEEIQWAKENALPVQPFMYGTDKGEESGSVWDEQTGTGSKDSPQSPIWGYGYRKLTPAKITITVDWDRTPFTQLHVAPKQAWHLSHSWKLNQGRLSLPFWAENKNTPCVPFKAQPLIIPLENGLAEQIKRHGLVSAFAPRHASSPRKYQFKDAALNRSLNAVFKSRDLYPNELVQKPLSLDSCPVDGEESHWMPVTEAPLQQMIDKEEKQRRKCAAISQLDELRKTLGNKKFEMLVASALGKTCKEISDELRANGSDVSPDAVKKALQRIRKQIKEVN